MKINLILVALICLVSVTGFAKEKQKPQNRKVSAVSCATKKWDRPFTSLEQLRSDFGSTERTELIQMFWGEITSPKPRAVAIPLAQYLAYTEQSSALSGYYQAVAMAAGSRLPLGDELEKWPKVSALKQVKAKLTELCELYTSAGGDDF